jgi:hypothetical protein
MREGVRKGRLTLARVTFRVSAETLEGAWGRTANGDFDDYDTDAAESVDWRVALVSIEENT